MSSFNKIIAVTDLHFGKRNNLKLHNERCVEFIEWTITQAKKENIDTCIFLGDWHDNRRSINVETLNYSQQAFELLSANFKDVYVISGNHDLFYKQKRDVTSIKFASNIDNIHIVNDITELYPDTVLVPWLMHDEYESLKNTKYRYMFGHFEFGGFFMNSMVKMPDGHGPDRSFFKNQEYIFSGHYHKRQQQDNIVYIGNAFPHDFSDVWDDQRGCMILEHGQTPNYRNWPNAPKYRSAKMSQVVQDPDKFLDSNTYIRVLVDLDLDYEQTMTFKEQVTQMYGVQDMIMIPKEDEIQEQKFEIGTEFQSVDQIVIEGLKSYETNGTIDNQLLIDIYNSLDVESN